MFAGSFPHASLFINYVTSCFDFYVIFTFNAEVLANSFTIDSCSETRLVFQSYLIHTDLQGVPYFDCWILSNTFLCNFLLAFWLTTLAFRFPAFYLAPGLICVCIFKSSILDFVDILSGVWCISSSWSQISLLFFQSNLGPITPVLKPSFSIRILVLSFAFFFTPDPGSIGLLHQTKTRGYNYIPLSIKIFMLMSVISFSTHMFLFCFYIWP